MDIVYLRLFREWQANLERHCEALHEMIEKPIDFYLSDKHDTDREQFGLFKQNIQAYAEATNRFRVNIISGILE